MSDGMSEAARDRAREVAYGVLALRTRQYLLNRTPRNKTLVLTAAQNMDGVRGGYFTTQTSASKTVEEKLSRLENGDKTEWARFLYEWDKYDDAMLDGVRMLYKERRSYAIWKTWTNDALYRKFMGMSPFSPKSVFLFSGTCGTGARLASVSPDLWSMFIKKLAKLGWRTNDPDDTYAIIVTGELKPKNMDIVIVYGRRDPTLRE